MIENSFLNENTFFINVIGNYDLLWSVDKTTGMLFKIIKDYRVDPLYGFEYSIIERSEFSFHFRYCVGLYLQNIKK